ncbi:MAG: glycerophosphodiester phosphodiesterase family protein [Planctomycetota bacterium]
MLNSAPDRDTLIVAHRGFHRDHPENSIPAIIAAAELGAHIVEVDVHRTNDGHFVLMHDWNVGRTTTGWGEMDEFSLAEIRELRLVHGIRVTSERVPTVEEALQAARGRIILNLDIKDGSIAEAAEIAGQLGLLDHCLFKLEWTPTARDIAAGMHERWPGIMIMPIVRSRAQLDAALGDTDRAVSAIELAVSPVDNPTALITEAADRTEQRGGRLWCNALGDWSISGLGDYNTPSEGLRVYQRLRALGCSIIQTDLPELALVALTGRENREQRNGR